MSKDISSQHLFKSNNKSLDKTARIKLKKRKSFEDHIKDIDPIKLISIQRFISFFNIKINKTLSQCLTDFKTNQSLIKRKHNSIEIVQCVFKKSNRNKKQQCMEIMKKINRRINGMKVVCQLLQRVYKKIQSRKVKQTMNKLKSFCNQRKQQQQQQIVKADDNNNSYKRGSSFRSKSKNNSNNNSTQTSIPLNTQLKQILQKFNKQDTSNKIDLNKLNSLLQKQIQTLNINRISLRKSTISDNQILIKTISTLLKTQQPQPYTKYLSPLTVWQQYISKLLIKIKNNDKSWLNKLPLINNQFLNNIVYSDIKRTIETDVSLLSMIASNIKSPTTSTKPPISKPISSSQTSFDQKVLKNRIDQLIKQNVFLSQQLESNKMSFQSSTDTFSQLQQIIHSINQIGQQKNHVQYWYRLKSVIMTTENYDSTADCLVNLISIIENILQENRIMNNELIMVQEEAKEFKNDIDEQHMDMKSRQCIANAKYQIQKKISQLNQILKIKGQLTLIQQIRLQRLKSKQILLNSIQQKLIPRQTSLQHDNHRLDQLLNESSHSYSFQQKYKQANSQLEQYKNILLQYSHEQKIILQQVEQSENIINQLKQQNRLLDNENNQLKLEINGIKLEKDRFENQIKRRKEEEKYAVLELGQWQKIVKNLNKDVEQFRQKNSKLGEEREKLRQQNEEKKMEIQGLKIQMEQKQKELTTIKQQLKIILQTKNNSTTTHSHQHLISKIQQLTHENQTLSSTNSHLFQQSQQKQIQNQRLMNQLQRTIMQLQSHLQQHSLIQSQFQQIKQTLLQKGKQIQILNQQLQYKIIIKQEQSVEQKQEIQDIIKQRISQKQKYYQSLLKTSNETFETIVKNQGIQITRLNKELQTKRIRYEEIERQNKQFVIVVNQRKNKEQQLEISLKQKQKIIYQLMLTKQSIVQAEKQQTQQSKQQNSQQQHYKLLLHQQTLLFKQQLSKQEDYYNNIIDDNNSKYLSNEQLFIKQIEDLKQKVIGVENLVKEKEENIERKQMEILKMEAEADKLEGILIEKEKEGEKREKRGNEQIQKQRILKKEIKRLEETNMESQRQLQIMTMSYNNLRLLIDQKTKPLERVIIHRDIEDSGISLGQKLNMKSQQDNLKGEFTNNKQINNKIQPNNPNNNSNYFKLEQQQQPHDIQSQSNVKNTPPISQLLHHISQLQQQSLQTNNIIQSMTLKITQIQSKNIFLSQQLSKHKMISSPVSVSMKSSTSNEITIMRSQIQKLKSENKLLKYKNEHLVNQNNMMQKSNKHQHIRIDPVITTKSNPHQLSNNSHNNLSNKLSSIINKYSPTQQDEFQLNILKQISQQVGQIVQTNNDLNQQLQLLTQQKQLLQYTIKQLRTKNNNNANTYTQPIHTVIKNIIKWIQQDQIIDTFQISQLFTQMQYYLEKNNVNKYCKKYEELIKNIIIEVARSRQELLSSQAQQLLKMKSQLTRMVNEQIQQMSQDEEYGYGYRQVEEEKEVRIKSMQQLNQVGRMLKEYSKNKDPRIMGQVERLLVYNKKSYHSYK